MGDVISAITISAPRLYVMRSRRRAQSRIGLVTLRWLQTEESAEVVDDLVDPFLAEAVGLGV
jgi:hypothetical protein